MLNSRPLISPSIIASDLTDMARIASALDTEVIDLLHMDVMDGRFVPNLTFGPGFISSLKTHTEIPLDVHLMIEEPERSIEEYLALEPWVTVIHYESTRFPARLLNLVREEGGRSGLAINPATPLESIFDILPYADLVCIMSVDPGFYGQGFMEPALGRIARLKQHLREEGLEDVLIQVDGGINLENASRVFKAGVDILVAGSAVFKGGDPEASVRALKQSALPAT